MNTLKKLFNINFIIENLILYKGFLNGEFIKTVFYFGLFRITKCINNVSIENKELFMYKKITYDSPLYATTSIDTDEIIYNETLMWVHLKQVETRPVIDKLKILHKKAVDSDYFKTLPTDVLPYIKDYLE